MQPIPLDQNWQLFLDDHFVARTTGLSRVLHNPTPRGVVIPADKPWETAGVETFCTGGIGRGDDGRFYAFYRALWWDPQSASLLPEGMNRDRAHHMRHSIAYASSDDGIRWHKPHLGLSPSPAAVDGQGPWSIPLGETTRNNIGVPITDITDLGLHGGVSDPQRRFVFRILPDTSDPSAQSMATVASAQWPGCFSPSLPDLVEDRQWRKKLTDTGGTLNPRRHYLNFWDDAHQEWVALDQGCAPGYWLPSREIARFASGDLRNWTVEAVLYPDYDDPHTLEQFDEPMTLHPFRAENVVIGLLSWFHSDRIHPEGGPRSDLPPGVISPWRWYRKGTNDIRLTVSRDGGKTWDRSLRREAWIPHGTAARAYDRMTYRPIPPVFVGEEDWFYVTVADGDHLVVRNNLEQAPYYHDSPTRLQIALYTQRHNRYVSLSAGSAGPQVLITRPIVLQGEKLELNVDAGHGRVRVAIASASDQHAELPGGVRAPAYAPHMAEPLSGFSFDDCAPIHADSIAEPVRFAAGRSLRELAGKPVFLLIELYDADLYGVRCG